MPASGGLPGRASGAPLSVASLVKILWLWWNVLSCRVQVKRDNNMLHTPRVTENVWAFFAAFQKLGGRERHGHT